MNEDKSPAGDGWYCPVCERIVSWDEVHDSHDAEIEAAPPNSANTAPATGRGE